MHLIKIVHGSIFDTKCDLLIIPCSSTGSITPSVKADIFSTGLPVMKRRLEFGGVKFLDTYGSYEISMIVGYAASVNATSMYSDKKAISKIAKKIGDYAIVQKVRRINIPLLGTGAGGLSYKESYEALASILSLEKYASLEIFIYHLSPLVKEDLLDFIDDRETSIKLQNPRVFISYTGVDKENAEWTKKLVSKLRNNGVDARMDIYHLKPGQDLPQWMTNELIMANKVLLICDKEYMSKANIRNGGVGWETMIIQGDMLSQGETMNKYIAIVREEDVMEGLPIYMKSKFCFHWCYDNSPSEDDFERLLVGIFDCEVEPELGEIPERIKNYLSSE